MNQKFNSVFAPFISDFIALKRQCGIRYVAEEKILKQFDRMAAEQNIKKPIITNEFAAKLSESRPNEAKGTRYKRCITLNQFSLYLSQNGYESAKCIAPKPKKTFIPYIYTRKETDLLLQAADNMRVPYVTHDSICFAMPALLRFLLSTGVRIGEAVKIEDKDMDLANNIFILRDTKNGKERLLPFDESLAKVLRQYERHRNRCNPLRTERYFFCTYRGHACKPENIYQVFRKLLVIAGIPFKGNHYGPRIHDFRHTFAVRSLRQMVDNGMDIYCTLPILSTYLGHQSLEATNHYVRICTEMYPNLVHSLEGVFNNIFPSLTHDFHEDN